MSKSEIGAVTLGLTAAVSWGGADFVGGVATKRASVYGVVIGAELTGLLVLVPLALFSGEPIPPMQVWVLGGLAGLCGGFGLTLLYQALATGMMSIAAPVSAVVGAAIPVLVGAFTQGFPKGTTIAGIFLGLIAILLIANQKDETRSFSFKRKKFKPAADRRDLLRSFLRAAARREPERKSLANHCHPHYIDFFLILIATFLGKPRFPARQFWPLVILSGIMDTGGNAFYVFAGQVGRLDIAAVLSSLYPAGTVLLAWLILKERAAPIQILGIVAAFIGILLIVI